MIKNKVIGIFGATGCNDFGDYAMLINNLRYFYNIYCDYEYKIFSYNIENTENNIKNNLKDIDIKYDVVDDLNKRFSFIEKVINKLGIIIGKKNFYRAKYWDNMWKRTFEGNLSSINSNFLKELEECDKIIFMGGGYIQNSWKLDNIKFMCEINCAHFLNKDIFFLGSTIGPVDEFQTYVANSIKFVKSIMVRDSDLFSYNNLVNMNYSNKILKGPDDLLFIEKGKKKIESYKKDYEYIVIEVMAWIDRAKNGKKFILDNIVEFCNYIIKQENKHIVLVNFHKEDIQGYNSIDYIINNIENKSMIELINNIDNIYFIDELYKNCKFSLSFRYHPLVLALGNKKSCIGVITDTDGYYYSKFAGAIKNLELNVEDSIMYIDDFNFNNLYNKYNKLINDFKVDDMVMQKLYLRRINYIEDILK